MNVNLPLELQMRIYKHRIDLRLRYYWSKLTRPFRIRTIYHERSKILYRGFPPKFEIEYHPSIQDKIDDIGELGGIVPLDTGEHIVDRPIILNKDYVTLIGSGPKSKLYSQTDEEIIIVEGNKITISNIWVEGNRND